MSVKERAPVSDVTYACHLDVEDVEDDSESKMGKKMKKDSYSVCVRPHFTAPYAVGVARIPILLTQGLGRAELHHRYTAVPQTCP